MRRPISYIVVLLATLFMTTSCGEFTRVQKSTDVMEKYSYAKKYYNTGKHKQAAALLEEVVPYLKGTAEAENSLYLQAQNLYKMKEYQEAQIKFQEYYNTYPAGEYAELSRFYSGYGLTQNLPDPRLDQGQTYAAIRELQLFLDFYPQSERAPEARQLLFDMQEQLALKQLLAARLYYNLGNYIFNNYQSAIITARNAMRDYPYSVHKEELHFIVVASLYEIARNSVIEKQQVRLRDLRDEYYNYINEFPGGKHKAELEKYFVYANKNIREEA